MRERGPCAPSSGPPSLSPVNVHNHAYLRLLTWSHASDPFPEVNAKPPEVPLCCGPSPRLTPPPLLTPPLQTVLMDQVRFQEMHREEERLVMLSSVLLIVYTTTGEAISGLPGLMEKLKDIVSAIFADMHAA